MYWALFYEVGRDRLEMSLKLFLCLYSFPEQAGDIQHPHIDPYRKKRKQKA